MSQQLLVRSILKGLGTRIPLVDRLANSAAGSSVGARYFYAVWLRHLVSVQQRSPSFCFDVVGDNVFPTIGLAVDLLPLKPDDIDEQTFCESMTTDDFGC